MSKRLSKMKVRSLKLNTKWPRTSKSKERKSWNDRVLPWRRRWLWMGDAQFVHWRCHVLISWLNQRSQSKNLLEWRERSISSPRGEFATRTPPSAPIVLQWEESYRISIWHNSMNQWRLRTSDRWRCSPQTLQLVKSESEDSSPRKWNTLTSREPSKSSIFNLR